MKNGSKPCEANSFEIEFFAIKKSYDQLSQVIGDSSWQEGTHTQSGPSFSQVATLMGFSVFPHVELDWAATLVQSYQALLA